jgi:hypothetical protein
MKNNSIAQKGKKQIEKKINRLQKLTVEYVPVNSIKPNTYNPNRQGDFEFELLVRSIIEDGFTQPIVCQKSTREFVDGEHRWTAFIVVNHLEDNGLIKKDSEGNVSFNPDDVRKARDKRFEIIKKDWMIPVVFVEMSIEQMKISTLRHNKAKGTHDIELEAQVLKDLQELGAIDWAQDSLMLSDVEINRMLEDISAPEALQGDEYSQSWVPDELGDEDNNSPSTVVKTLDGTTHGGEMVTASSVKAVQAIQERQNLIEKAKNEEERELARQQTKLYRVSLIFSNEEATIIEQVLGREPAVKLLEMCKNELGK